MTAPTFISLFAGIGGIDLGLERAGWEARAQVEIDPYASKVLAKHWPHVARFGDIRGCGAHNLPPVDLIAGGFPCQDISSAGKRAGITGERSGLWAEYARIISEIRPRYVLVENVSALLRRGLDTVLGDLASSGYDAEWDCIPAAAVGAPHRRDRVFVVAYAKSGGWGAGPTMADSQGLRLRPGLRAGGPEGERGRRFGDQGSAIPDAECYGLERIFQGGAAERAALRSRGDWWTFEPGMGRVAHGIPARVDRLRGLGNAVVPQVAEYIGRRIYAHWEQSHGT